MTNGKVMQLSLKAELVFDSKSKFKVNKNGVAAWHVVEAESAQVAVESFYGVQVYEYDRSGCVIIFDDIRDEVNQLYAVDISLD